MIWYDGTTTQTINYVKQVSMIIKTMK